MPPDEQEVEIPTVPMDDPADVPTEDEPVDLEASEDSEEEQPPEDDEVELDIDGEKYRVPKKLEEAFLRTADYTQKTQAHAEAVRAFEAERVAQTQRAQDQEQFLTDIAEVRGVDARLAEFANVDWNTLTIQNPQQALQLQIQRQQLLEYRQQKVQELDGKVSSHVAAQEAAEAQSVQKTIEALQKPGPDTGWPGYSVQHMAKLATAAKELGVSDADLRRIRSPTALKILNLATIGRQTLLAAKKAKVPTTVQAQPVKQVNGSRAVSAKDPMKMPIEDWVKAERRRMAKNAHQ
jgi:hypothetical protein